MAASTTKSLQEAFYFKKTVLEEGPVATLLLHKGPQEGAQGQLNNRLGEEGL